jgi:hypothetical protein
MHPDEDMGDVRLIETVTNWQAGPFVVFPSHLRYCADDLSENPKFVD